MKRLGLGIGLAFGPVTGVSLHFWRQSEAYTQSLGYRRGYDGLEKRQNVVQRCVQ